MFSRNIVSYLCTGLSSLCLVVYILSIERLNEDIHKTYQLLFGSQFTNDKMKKNIGFLKNEDCPP
jgi:hypothetical protein